MGVTHTVGGPLVLCERGLHWSENILEALEYAGGAMLWRVRYSGDVVRGDDKGCSTERTYVRGAHAGDMLRHFARLCALDVVGLWDAPDVVVRYLRTGDESLRTGAWAGASADAGADAGAAAKSAAWAAAGAAWVASRAASRATPSAAARAVQSRRLTRMARELLRTA